MQKAGSPPCERNRQKRLLGFREGRPEDEEGRALDGDLSGQGAAVPRLVGREVGDLSPQGGHAGRERMES